MRRLCLSCVAAVCAALALGAGAPGIACAEPAAKHLFSRKEGPANMSPRAIGFYTRGCLAGAAELPVTGPAWQAMRLSRNRNWGHPDLVALVKRLAVDSKQKDGWPGLLVGDLAQPRGGPMPSDHVSHQVGLDADIWYRPMPDRVLSREEREEMGSIALAKVYGTEVIGKNWRPGYVQLLKRAASYPQTQRILVHPAVKKKLCETAGGDRDWLRKVRPWWKHNYHFHLRIRCPAGADNCRDQSPPPKGEGCGAQIDYWMKKLHAAAEWAKKPKPKKKKKPSKDLTMADLPNACRAVLDADSVPVPVSRPASPAAQPVRAATNPGLPWRDGAGAPSIPLPLRKPQ